ncbi:MAG: CAP domain-containing protein [Planctomycetia bacterium]|nr:CAP domain-containing protein [Planctomycetia bacterium]
MPRSPFLVIAFACALTSASYSLDDKKDELKLTADEEAVIELTNAERKKADLKPLKVSPVLMIAARKHGENMAKQDKLDHVLDEKDPAQRAKDAGYKSEFVGENIAWKQKTAKDVLTAWMDSKIHRENILLEEFTEIGVAVTKNSKGELYWVQVFGKP